jgi:tetratricopeptide (TPR) repeat protein
MRVLKNRRRTQTAGILALTLMAAGCGQYNPNGYLAGSGETKSSDYLVERANYYYNKGEFTKAADFAEQALDVNGKNEDAVVVAGYTYLSLAGIDPFNLAEGMINLDSGSSSSRADSANSANILLSLSSVLGLSDADRAKLVIEDESNTEHPVDVPKCAETARTAISQLRYANKAINLICPWVNSSTHITDDERHDCHATTATISQSGRFHFLWAFSHLAESLALSTALLGTESAGNEGGSQMVNLQARATEASGLTDITAMVNKAGEVSNLMAELFPASLTDVANTCNKNSTTKSPQTPIFFALLNDMQAVSKGLGAISGIPEDVTSQITGAMDGITGEADRITKFRTQMTAKIDGVMGTLSGKISANIGSATGNDKIELCKQYKQLNPTTTDVQLQTMGCPTTTR